MGQGLHEYRSELGLKTMVEGENSIVDIVAIHGLNGDREKTFTTRSGGVNWLQDLLPIDIPNARILSYGYDSRTHGFAQKAKERLYDHGILLLEKLQKFREHTSTQERPIIFLAHSLGGIIVKGALIHASLDSNEYDIKKWTAGVMFFGTPHQGTKTASYGFWGLQLMSFFFHTNLALIQQLEKDSDFLGMQRMQYGRIGVDFESSFFYECFKTPVRSRGWPSIMVVSNRSATIPGDYNPSFPLNKSHTELVRFRDRSDADYKIVVRRLKDLAARSHEIIAKKRGLWAMTCRTDSSATIKKFTMRLPFDLPVHQNYGFVGRQDLLDDVHRAFSNRNDGADVRHASGSSSVVVLHGLPGAGKTQLSVAYASAHRKEFDIIHWVDGNNKNNTLLSYQNLAQRLLDEAAQLSEDANASRRDLASRMRIGEHLRADGQIQADHDGAAMIQLLESDDENFTWLLIIDNVDDVEDYPLDSFIPRSSRGRIIITSRLTRVADYGTPIEVDQLELDTAVDMVLKATVQARRLTDRDDAKNLAVALGCLPLALEQARGFIHDGQISLKDYIQLLDENRSGLLRDPGRLTTRQLTASSTGAHQLSVYATYDISFQRLERDDTEAAKLLTLLSFLHRSSFWEGLIHIPFPPTMESDQNSSAWLHQLAKNKLGLQQALRRIFSISLGKRTSDESSAGNVIIHPLVHTWGRDRLTPSTYNQYLTDAIYLVGTAIARANAVWPPTPETRAYLTRLSLHTDQVATLLLSSLSLLQGILTSTVAHSLYHLATHLLDTTRLTQAEAIFTALCAQPEPVLAANSLRYLGQIHILFSRYSEAEDALTASISALTALLGPTHPSTLYAVFSLGMVHHRCFRYPEAESYLRRAISNATTPSTRALGREASSILGLVYRHLGRLEEALSLLDDVLSEASDQQDAPAHLLTLRYRRALIAQDLGHWDDALEEYLDVYTGFSNVLDTEHPLTLRAANALGMLYRLMGQWEEARRMLETARRGQETLGFSKENETAQLRTDYNLAALDREQGHLEEAEARLGKVVQAERRLHGTKAHSTLRCDIEMAVLRTAQGQASEAVKVLKRVLETQMEYYSDAGADHAYTRTMLAEALVRMGNVDEALDVLQPAVEFARSSWKLENPMRLRVELAMADCLVACGKGVDVGPTLGEVVARLEMAFGTNHPLSARGRAILG
ncbi:hypothetical protein QBC34DRAFT_435996 [Podospora aff. communis PSN243]|uniref:NB-ARC domain-containing protein n=1 Tax=Podospora aff. communis PSN243 TaxID=3040156 RepID=A0AAV9GV74_9PEZI|nr:hypothetical protein QBC34DRAFT_435996 [Podospora aff. communis PSN243]